MLKSLNAAFPSQLPSRKTFVKNHIPDLYRETKSRVSAFFRQVQAPRTLGFDSFKTEKGAHVVSFTETIDAKSAFKSCVDPGSRQEDHSFFVEVIEHELKSGAEETGAPIFEVYCGVTGDNVGVNRKAMDLLEEKYPKLLFAGCAAHAFDVMIEHLSKLPEVDNVISKAKDIVKFVRSHKIVLRAFEDIIGPRGRTLKLFPDTRFGYAAETLERVIENRESLEQLINGVTWVRMISNVKTSVVSNFENLIGSYELWRRFECCLQLLYPVSKAIHHIEGDAAKASWVYPLAVAVLKDVSVWGRARLSVSLFTMEMRVKAVTLVTDRWTGTSNKVGLSNRLYSFAWLVDPYSTPWPENIPDFFMNGVLLFLKKFFDEPELSLAMNQAEKLVLREEAMGAQVTSSQEGNTLSLEEEALLKTVTEKLICLQRRMLSPYRKWFIYGSHFNLLVLPAVRALSFKPQSASVERICSAHKMVHTKVRSRLSNKNVQMLLYCYVNLRLINKCDAEIGDFLMEALGCCESDS